VFISGTKSGTEKCYESPPYKHFMNDLQAVGIIFSTNFMFKKIANNGGCRISNQFLQSSQYNTE